MYAYVYIYTPCDLMNVKHTVLILIIHATHGKYNIPIQTKMITIYL